MLFKQIGFEPACAGPAQIHAHEHLSPILALSAAGAGVEFDVCVVAVSFAGEQRFKLSFRSTRLRRLQSILRFADEAFIAFCFREFGKFDAVAKVALKLGVDPRKADQMVRGTVVLPHGLGKSKRVLAIAGPDKQKEATEAAPKKAPAKKAAKKATKKAAKKATKTAAKKPAAKKAVKKATKAA